MENVEMKETFVRSRKKGQDFRTYILQEIRNNSTIDINDCWVKLDAGVIKYGRLSIAFREVEDYRKGCRLQLSGIFRENAKIFYVQGSDELWFVFCVENLRKWFYEYGYMDTHIWPYPPKKPTVEKSYLSIEHSAFPNAWKLCVGVFDYRTKKKVVMVDKKIIMPKKRPTEKEIQDLLS